MEEETNKSIAKKLGDLTGFIKNAKFLVLTGIALLTLATAILSGDGKPIILGLYEKLTGERYQTFSPVQDYSNATYIILKDKLSRDTDIGLENMTITIFEESNTSHRYRVEYRDEILFYSVKKKQDKTWQINMESGPK